MYHMVVVTPNKNMRIIMGWLRNHTEYLWVFIERIDEGGGGICIGLGSERHAHV